MCFTCLPQPRAEIIFIYRQRENVRQELRVVAPVIKAKCASLTAETRWISPLHDTLTPQITLQPKGTKSVTSLKLCVYYFNSLNRVSAHRKSYTLITRQTISRFIDSYFHNVLESTGKSITSLKSLK